MAVENSKNVNTGDVKTNGGDVHIGDVAKTVNYYLSENKLIKDLSNKIKGIDEKLNKDGISKDLKEHLLQEKYGYQQEYEKLYKAIEKAYHDVLKFGFTDEELKELQQLFFEGKHQEIEEKVNPKAIEENINIREEANKKDANKLLILAKSTAIQFEDEDRFERTVEYYELSLKADRNKDNLYSYAHFLQLHNQNNEATPLYEETLPIYRKLAGKNSLKYSLKEADLLNNLGILYFRMNKFTEAENSIIYSLNIYQILSKENEKTYDKDIAVALVHLGNIQQERGKLDDAEESYLKSLSKYESLAEFDFLTHAYLGANAMNSLGTLYTKFGEKDIKKREQFLKKAERFFNDALDIYTKIKKHTNLLILPDEINPLGNLASLKMHINQPKNAIKYLTKAKEISEKLVTNNPEAYLPILADILNRLAKPLSLIGEIDDAEEAFKDAIKKYCMLSNSNSNPQTYLPRLAHTKINLGKFYQVHKVDRELSIQLVDEAFNYLLYFYDAPFFKEYQNFAFSILHRWEIDLEKYWEEKLTEFESQIEKQSLKNKKRTLKTL